MARTTKTVNPTKVYSIKFDVRAASRGITALNKKLETANDYMERLGVVSKIVQRKIGKVGDGMKKLGKETERASRSMKQFSRDTKKADKTLQRLGARMKRIGSFMSRYLTIPAGIAGVASLKLSRDLNKGMSTIATLIPGNIKRVRELKSGIQQLAKDSGASMDDLTSGVYTAISAWADSTETMEKVRIATMASQAGLADTESTLGLLTSVTEIYGDSTAKAVEHLTDLAFVANKLAIKAPFAEMASSMGKSAVLAKQVGLSQEELFATMTAGAGVTGTVSEVATQMESLYTSIIKETPQLATVVKKSNKELGTSFADASEMIGKLGTIKFLEQIKKNTKNSKEFQKVLGGRKEGLILSMALLESRTGKYNEAMDEMMNKTGQMRVAHAEISEGINKEGYEWERTKQRIVVFAQRIGDKLLPVLSKLSKRYLEPLLKKIDEMDEATLEWWMKLIGMGAAIGPLMKLLGPFVSMMGGMGTNLALANTGIAGVNAGLGGMIGKTAKLSTLAGVLGTVGAGLAALTVGAGVGTMIHELWSGPSSERKAKKIDNAHDAMRMSRATRRRGQDDKFSSQMKAIDAIDKAAKELPRSGFSAETVLGGLPALLSGDIKNQPGMRMIDTARKLKKERDMLAGDISGQISIAQRQMMSSQQRAKTPGPPIINVGGAKVTVNAGGGDAKKIAREVNKTIDKSMKRSLNQAARGIGASEQ